MLTDDHIIVDYDDLQIGKLKIAQFQFTDLQRQADRKFSTSTDLTADLDRSAHQIDDFLRDRHPQATAFCFIDPAVFFAGEGFKNIPQKLRFDSDSGIPDCKYEPGFGRIL